MAMAVCRFRGATHTLCHVIVEDPSSFTDLTQQDGGLCVQFHLRPVHNDVNIGSLRGVTSSIAKYFMDEIVYRLRPLRENTLTWQ
jgi:hypothetical protein